MLDAVNSTGRSTLTVTDAAIVEGRPAWPANTEAIEAVCAEILKGC